MSARYENAKQIFVHCFNSDSHESREQLLKKVAQADPTLAQEVRELLKDVTAGAVIDQEFGIPGDLRLTDEGTQTHSQNFNSSEFDLSDRPPIGSYKLLKQIGEGGMGSVYLAQQFDPVKRQVALKVIKLGMDSHEVISRFEAERQMLAIMEHPNIAKVLDGGTTEQGRPYFVMELVHGVPITDYCNRNDLSLRSRIELLTDVCKAVQHAHQKGVIHRDLKPSNVMVTSQDERPIAKVIDFGIAKAVKPELTEKIRLTQHSQLMGSPLYMSPEQAELGIDIDTRSDVYSLGVLLYELLTGTTPFEREELGESGFDEVRRVIREVIPPRPSARLSTPALAQNSTMSLTQFARAIYSRKTIHDDLDWIAMKALEKDRTRRYGSANELADDLQRYLDDQPVLACPPSVSYQVRKYARRHKVQLQVAIMMASLLVTSAWLLWSERKQTLQALAGETVSRRAAEVQQKIAQDNLDFAIQAVDEMYLKLATRWIADETAPTGMQRGFLDQAIHLYNRVAAMERKTETELIRAASAYQKIAKIESYLQRDSHSLSALDDAIKIGRQLSAAHPSSQPLHADLLHRYDFRASTHLRHGNLTAAGQDYQSALPHLNYLENQQPNSPEYSLDCIQFKLGYGQFLLRDGQLEEADLLVNDIMTELGPLSGPRSLATFIFQIESRQLFAQISAAQGDFAEAKETAIEGLNFCGQVRDFSASDERQVLELEPRLIQLLGEIAESQGQLEEAASRYRESLETMRLGLKSQKEASQAVFPGFGGSDGKWEPRELCTYIEVHLKLARVLAKLNRPYDAEYRLSQCALAIYVISAGDPQVLRYQVAEANTWAMVWQLLLVERPSEASAALDYAILIWREVLDKFPMAAGYYSGVHGSNCDLVWFRSLLDLESTARLESDEPIPVYEVWRFYPTIAFSTQGTGRSWYDGGDFRMALRFLEQSATLRDEDHAYPWLHLAMAHAKLGEHEESLRWLQQARESIDQMPDPPSELQELFDEAKQVVESESLPAVSGKE